MSASRYVRPQKVFPISVKFGMYIELDDQCTTICRMTRSKIKVTARPAKTYGKQRGITCCFQ